MENNSQSTSSNQMNVIIGIIAVAVIATGIFIALQRGDSGVEFSYDTLHQERTEDGAFIIGDPAAPVTIVAFEDFLCPHCQNYQPDVKEILSRYVTTGQARFEFRMLPISDVSKAVFGLAECAEEIQPGSFWEGHDTLFKIASTSRFDDSSPRQFAEEMDISYNDLLECMRDADQWQADQRLASRYSEITGTPSVGWRLNGGELRFDVINRRPSPDQIGGLLELALIEAQQ